LTVHDLTSTGLSDGCVGFRVPRGRVIWTDADYLDGADGSTVVISRLESMPGMTLRAFTRRVPSDTEAVLVPASHRGQEQGTSEGNS
jgi:hypothetical protein